MTLKISPRRRAKQHLIVCDRITAELGNFHCWCPLFLLWLDQDISMKFWPRPPTPEFLSKDFCLQPGLEWKFLPRRTWLGPKLLPPQFPGLSPYYLQDTKEYLNQRGYLNRTFPGAKKGGNEGGGEEGRSGARMHRAWRGKEGGRNEGKRMGGKGSESTLEKLWFWYPSDLGTL